MNGFLNQTEYESLLIEVFRQAGIDAAAARRVLDSRWPLIGYAGILAEATGRGFQFEQGDLRSFIEWCRTNFGDCVPVGVEDRLDTIRCTPEFFHMFETWLELTGLANPTMRTEILSCPEGKTFMDAALKAAAFGEN